MASNYTVHQTHHRSIQDISHLPSEKDKQNKTVFINNRAVFIIFKHSHTDIYLLILCHSMGRIGHLLSGYCSAKSRWDL